MMTVRARRGQAGITVIGFLIMAAVFGAIGLAVIKVVPLYMEKMGVVKVLEDVKSEVAGSSTAQAIRSSIEARLYIENLRIPREQISVTRQGDSYLVRIDHEARAPFFADLSFVVDIDEQVEIGL